MSSLTRLAPVLLAGLFASSCLSHDKPAWLAQKQANDAIANYYAEATHEGRLYVFGSETSFTAFAQTHELALRVAFINAGPEGQTVYVEADKGGDMERRLIRQFDEKHGIKLR